MTIADNLRNAVPAEFLDACKKLSGDERFMNEPELTPYAAMTQVIVWHMERLAQRTEIECKHEMYYAVGKQPPSDKQLLRGTE